MRRTSVLLGFVILLGLAAPAVGEEAVSQPPTQPAASAPDPTPVSSPPPPVQSSAPAPLPPALPSPTPNPSPILGLTVSGGVSLGSFEAGYLYYLFETLKLNPGLADPRIFTGASAGSANALLSLAGQLLGAEPRPDNSLFYRTWIPVGLKQLFDPREGHARVRCFTQDALRETLDSIGKSGMRASRGAATPRSGFPPRA